MLFLSRADLAAQLKKPLHSMWQPCWKTPASNSPLFTDL